MAKRKIDIIAICSIVILGVIFYTVFLKDDIFAYRPLSQKRTSLEEAIIRDRITVEHRKDKETHVQNLEKEIRENKLLFLKEEKTPYFLNYISSLASRDKVAILSIEPGETLSEDLVTKTMFTAEIKGGFPYIYTFLYHLEDNWRGVKVETLSINKNPEDNSIDIRLKLAVLSISGFEEKT